MGKPPDPTTSRETMAGTDTTGLGLGCGTIGFLITGGTGGGGMGFSIWRTNSGLSVGGGGGSSSFNSTSIC